MGIWIACLGIGLTVFAGIMVEVLESSLSLKLKPLERNAIVLIIALILSALIVQYNLRDYCLPLILGILLGLWSITNITIFPGSMHQGK